MRVGLALSLLLLQLGSWCVGGGPSLGALGLPAAAADWDVAEDATFGPVAAAALAEMAGLGEVVVVVVAELGVERVAPRALESLVVVLVVLIVMRSKPPVPSSASSSACAASEQPATPSDRMDVLHFANPPWLPSIFTKEYSISAVFESPSCYEEFWRLTITC
jgi:hypothetical protein